MNPFFNALALEMAGRHGTTGEELAAALFMVRAHWSLAGLVLCCRRLCELEVSHPDICRSPAFTDQDRRLETLRRIAALDDFDDHFLSGGLASSISTPLRPYTGESGLCELLLIESYRVGDSAHREDFNWLMAWFCWQTFHHQAKSHDPEAHRLYLLSDDPLASEDSVLPRLNKGFGTRIYNASRELRNLADPSMAARASEIRTRLGTLTERDSVELALLIRLSDLASPARTAPLRKYAVDEYGYTHSSLEARRSEFKSIVPREVGLFLSLIWLKTLEAKLVRAGGGGGGAALREVTKPLVRRYGELSTVTTVVDEDGMQAGYMVDFFLKSDAMPTHEESEHDLPIEGEPDPDDGEAAEPSLSIFLAKEGDLLRSWFASRSAAHHQEAANALLPWSKWRLSRAAIAKVLAVVVPEPQESVVRSRARLAIGLSLLSGRSLEQADTVAIHGGQIGKLDDGCPLAICTDDLVLHVFAARPKLKQDAPSRKFCAPHVDTLRLPLPEAWRPLIEQLSDKPRRHNREVLTAARALLKELPAHMAISPRSVAVALKLGLMEQGEGDLGLVKVVTDTSDVNTENIIHYASYLRAHVEATWRTIAETWVGALGRPQYPDIPDERVGCLQAFVIERIASQISLIKAKFRKAVLEKRWPAVLNNINMYFSAWSALAVAGRRTRQPVPPSISPDGWAFVSDKSRPDESTDRLVPLTAQYQLQLQVIRRVTAAMGIVDADYLEMLDPDNRILNLRIYDDLTSNSAFQPKIYERYSSLKGLPANWARKLVRSESPELAGRFKDAGLGHWVQGRHPWSLNSTFPTSEFKDKWIQLQTRLETALGFEVLDIDGLGAWAAENFTRA